MGIGGRKLKEIGRPCPYCGQPMRQGRSAPSPDHMRPRARGGRAGQNILYVCRQCNVDKGTMSLSDFLADLEEKQDRRARYVRQFIANAPSRVHFEFDPST